MVQDASVIKERIISLLKKDGPNLPVYMAKEIGFSTLFTSAFLSELFSEKRIKISNMRVGNSPVYFLPGQEPLLEKFSGYLKSKEKEAYLLLKEKQFLKDKEQEPAIRVALREIKDFALAFQKGDEIIWRYLTSKESEFHKKEKPEIKIQENKKEKTKIQETQKEGELNIFDKQKLIKKERKNPAKKAKKSTKKSQNERNKFFNKVKEFLNKKQINIIDIEEIGTAKIIFKVKEQEEYLIIAYNKKRINEQDIINAYKKSKELGIPYKILNLGETLKKIDNLIQALKSLKEIERIE